MDKKLDFPKIQEIIQEKSKKTWTFSWATKRGARNEHLLKSNLRLRLDLLCDLCSLALTIAEIIKLCSSDLTLTNNVDVIDLG